MDQIASGATTCEPRPVVIDTDPGVDDALALMLALRSPEIRVELITTVAGNVPVENATDNVRRVLALMQPPVWPILARGAAGPLCGRLQTATSVHGSDGLGGLTQLRRADGSLRYPPPEALPVRRQAVPNLLRLVQRYGSDLTLIALGPLTNIARAIRRAPEVMQRLGRLVIMGGAIRVPGNVSPTAEFNIYVDPHAAATVFAAGLSITLIPLDVTRQVRLTRAFLQETVHGPGTTLVQATRHMTRHLLYGPDESQGMPMHDPLAVAAVLDPSLLTLTSLPLGVETQGRQTLGMTVADQRDPPRHDTDLPCIEVALEVDAPRVLALFAERVFSRRTRRLHRQSRRPGVVVVGSANTDLTVRTPHLPAVGETVLGQAFYTAFGGKGANQAVAASRAGAHVFLLAKFGRDRYGDDYARYLRREGLDLSGLRWDATRPSGVAIISVDRRGQNQIAVASGANAALRPDDLHGLDVHLASAQVLVTQLEIPLSTVEAALRQAKTLGVTTLLNPAPARILPARFARLIDVLIPNETEAEVLCGKPVGTLRQARVAVRLLRQRGYHTVIITLGKRGALLANDQGTLHLPGYAVQAKDTTAAGDTFVGYLACGLAQGQTLSEALILANAASAVTVTREGAQSSIPYRSEIQRLLDTR